MDVNKRAIIDTECYWAPEVNKPSDSSNDKPLLDWRSAYPFPSIPSCKIPLDWKKAPQPIGSLTKYASMKVIYLVPKFVGLI